MNTATTAPTAQVRSILKSNGFIMDTQKNAHSTAIKLTVRTVPVSSRYTIISTNPQRHTKDAVIAHTQNVIDTLENAGFIVRRDFFYGTVLSVHKA